MNDLAAQIATLELRAASRDYEAAKSAGGIKNYMLSLESRQLRKKAAQLRIQRHDFTCTPLGQAAIAQEFVQFGAGLAID